MIDWISISLTLPPDVAPLAHTTAIIARQRIADHVRAVMPELGMPTGESVTAQRPFKQAFRMVGATVHWHNYLSQDMSHVLVVLNGHDCEAARKGEWIWSFVERHAANCTRIDIAHDINCDADVIEFAESATKKVNSYSPVISSTGTTYYLGSRKARRTVRVYRWNKPHPRSHLLRIEYEFKKQDAKEIAARATSQRGVGQLKRDLGTTWGWQHEAYNLPEGEKVRAPVDDREHSATIIWLLSVCAPALRKQIEKGNLTAEQFLEAVAGE